MDPATRNEAGNRENVGKLLVEGRNVEGDIQEKWKEIDQRKSIPYSFRDRTRSYPKSQ